MDTNEKARDTASTDIIELGVASVETKGAGMTTNEIVGHRQDVGISD
ncbi:benenodin family lasso peptide [Pseudoxanthomonas winnipegensis]|uniref:Benenodin family lasso peptide n=1 Tax=Pseudoxanthomonas winnipegensis TaxID=2480810 RepID=A0A4Q9TFY6_9GAMM|nr:benenodin family lasso peptide [Pseudoxanthomonas winnipegensis]RZZ81613.1 benenodin family lasso peptide [Pseudoxanthomonas winnipegensis]TAA24726.1 benenodin family lasso peptide [Pseudoxanthomonas winnipegensis]TAA39978.1 benenodin family lasso peptide [Pseudoxanthomonas winnipegensis]TBV74605.1 benenodin family lasso peptide [Pseudoxanthomonas winnipegensis]TBV75455.1 benenodin family lasso peptide [Pseudoxanthomonas winnipegensis]